MSGSLPPHGLQRSRLPCPSPSPGACSNSCPLSQWCHPTIPFSVIPSPPALNLSQHQGLSSASWLFTSGGQSIEASALAFVPPVNIQNWFPLGLADLISLLSPRTLKSHLQQHSLKASILWCSAFFIVQLSHPYMTTGKTTALTILTFCLQGSVNVSAL